MQGQNKLAYRQPLLLRALLLHLKYSASQLQLAIKNQLNILNKKSLLILQFDTIFISAMVKVYCDFKVCTAKVLFLILSPILLGVLESPHQQLCFEFSDFDKYVCIWSGKWGKTVFVL